MPRFKFVVIISALVAIFAVGGRDCNASAGQRTDHAAVYGKVLEAACPTVAGYDACISALNNAARQEVQRPRRPFYAHEISVANGVRPNTQTFLLFCKPGSSNGTASKWLHVFSKLARWACSVGCPASVAVVDTPGPWFQAFRPGLFKVAPSTPFAIRLRHDSAGSRVMDVIHAENQGLLGNRVLLSLLDCLPRTVAAILDDAVPFRGHVVDGVWGRYFHLPTCGTEGWGPSEPLLPIDPGGLLVLPRDVRRIIIDVGTAEHSDFDHLLRHDPYLLVIGIEPLESDIEKAERGARRELHPSLLRRFWLLRAAIAQAELGPCAAFHRTADPHCSSLFAPDPAAEVAGAEGAAGDCSAVTKVDHVAVLPLKELLRRLPIEEVDLIKIDAQGADLEVIRSAGQYLPRVREVHLECQDLPRGDARLLYKHGHTKSEVLRFMSQRGFKLKGCGFNTADGSPHPLLEENCVFIRDFQIGR